MRWRILSAFIAGVFIFAGLVLTIMIDEIANSVQRAGMGDRPIWNCPP